MTIELYMIAYNEEEILPFVLDYYSGFCSKITVFDNWSTDRTREIAEKYGEVKVFGRAGVLDDQAYLDVKNHCWKGSKADFVIVCDTDEVLYHPDLVANLQAHPNATIFNTQGFEIFSHSIPRETLLELTTGVIDNNYSKNIIFSPKLKEIDFVFGCHVSRPKGLVNYGAFKPVVLHYRSIGGPDRMVKRYAERSARKKLSAINMRWNLGHHYDTAPNEIKKQWEESYARSAPLSQAGIFSS